jgi:23S rRNA (guanosine2251-2'-O)-methyltransferase
MKELLYGRNAVYETLRAKRRQVFQLFIGDGSQEKGRLQDILDLARQRKVPINNIPRPTLDRKVDANHQGVILEASAYPYRTPQDMLDLAQKRGEQPFLLLLDALNDPQNFGTLLRTAEAVGIHGVMIPLARTVDVTPAVVNASAGASEHLLVAQVNLHQAITDLKKENIWVIGLDQNGETVRADDRMLNGSLALVVGSEGEGMRALTAKSCDALIKLPMTGQIESLNAAVAGSVALYLAALARKKS